MGRFQHVGRFVLLAIFLVFFEIPASLARAQSAFTQTADARYGLFGMLDHGSRYGQYWFPEPFRMDETDVDNELRFDWVHRERSGRVAEDAKAALTASRVSSGGVWNTPSPRAGRVTPLFSVSVETSGMVSIL